MIKVARDNRDKVSEVWLSQQRNFRLVGHRLMSPKSKEGPDLGGREDRRCRNDCGGYRRWAQVSRICLDEPGTSRQQ